MSEPVPSALAGERLDRVVSIVTGCSRAVAADLVASGAVRLDGVVATSGSRRVEEGRDLEIERPPDQGSGGIASQPDVVVPVVFVDEHVIIVDKPAGMVVHPGAGNVDGTMVNGLVAAYPEIVGVGDADRPGIVHRLDAGTTGLLVVARSQPAYESLVGQLAARTVGRRYLALSAGEVAGDRGLIDAPIGRSSRSPTRMTVSDTGREARTGYEVIVRYREPLEATLLECELETGRTHQIRVHLASIGHPVLGDDKYGGVRARLPFPRPALHAAHLAFEHPMTGRLVALDAELPADLAGLLATLG